MSNNIEGKVVVITGASSSLGEATARCSPRRTASQVKKLVDTAVRTHGRVDVMINNADLMPQSPLERLKIEEWNRMIDVNIKGGAVRHRRSAAVYEGAKSRPYHQCFFCGRP